MADEIKLPDIVKDYLEDHPELIEYPNALLQSVQEDMAPFYVGQFAKVLYDCSIDFDLNKLYPQYNQIRVFDIENFVKILPSINKYFMQIKNVIDLKEPISPEIFEKIAEHAMSDNLLFLRKRIPVDIHQIQTSFRVDRDENSSYRGYIYVEIAFYDMAGIKITDAFLDVTYSENLFGVLIPDLGYAINVDKARIALNKAVHNIQYLAKYFKE